MSAELQRALTVASATELALGLSLGTLAPSTPRSIRSKPPEA